MVTVRKGQSADLRSVLELVKQLAIFEKAPDEVEVTTREMKAWFETDRLFDFFVLEKDGVIAGIALYYYKYSTWKGKCLFLEDIIVTENERNKGYGKLLFAAVVNVARHENVRRMEWQVLAWNKPAIEFYKKYRSHFDEEWINCKLVGEQIQSM